MKYILPYLRPYRRQTALAMVLVAFATVCDLLLPTIMNDILNHGVRQSDFAYIVRCCVWMLAVAAAGLAALLAGRKISCDVVAGFNADLRTDVFSLVNNMTFEEFNAIGHVPFRDKDKMYYDYHAALDKVHKVLNADSQRRRMEKVKADIEFFKQQLKELNESK